MEESSSHMDDSHITRGGKSLGFPRKNKLIHYSKALISRAVAPVFSWKTVHPKKLLRGTTFLFLFKVASIEFLRQVSTARCPQLWWGLQIVPFLHVFGFHWLQKLTHLKFLLTGIQAFSMPIMCLSLASNMYQVFELKRETGHVKLATNSPMASEQSSVERFSHEQEETVTQGPSRNLLREVLDKDGATLTERISDEELDRFLFAANGNVKRAVTNIKKTLRWREKFYFFTSSELEIWSHLVFWHGHDAKLRPTLVIRLGVAYSSLSTQQYRQFAQVVVSQVEHGVLNLVHKEDPRIIVVMDCRGTSVLGFPVQMMKSCCICLQKNYPTRLACLVAVNVPAVVRVIATAIIQILTPATRQKVHVEGETYVRLLEHLEGFEHIVNCLAGNCQCSACEKANTVHNLENRSTANVHFLSNGDHLDLETSVPNPGRYVSSRAFKALIRKTIVALLMIWIIMTIATCISSYPGDKE